MKKLIILSMSISFLSLSQETKQHKGEFYDGTINPGEATYSYYDKNGERLKHGLFSYNRKSKTDDGAFTSKISGNFKNNLRDGKWTFLITFTDWENGSGNYITGNVSLISSYKDGIPNGQWIYKESSKSRIKNRTLNGFVWSSYTKPKSSNATVTFKNGVLSGDFNTENLLVTDNIKGFFNEKGMVNGRLSIKYAPTYDEGADLEYYKDIMIKHTEFNSSGEITNKLNLNADDIKRIQDFADKLITSDDLKKNRLKVDTLKLITLRDFNSNIYNELFLCEHIQGDLVFNGKINFGGYHIQTTKFELMKLSEIEGMESAESYMEDKSNITYIKEARTRFEKIKNQYENNLSTEDLAKLNNKITECNNALNNAKEAKQKTHERKNEWSKINSLRISGADIHKLQDALKNAKDFREKYKSYLTEDDKELTDYNSSIKTSYAMNDKELVEEKIKSLEQALEQAIINTTKKEYNQKEKEIESLYIVKDEMRSAVSGQTTYKSIKKHLYNAYEILKKDLESKIENSDEISKKNDLYKEALTLSDKMIELSNAETKDLEKRLKRETDPQKIKEILGL